MIALMRNLLNKMRLDWIGVEVIQNMQQIIYEINTELYQLPVLKFQKEYSFEKEADYFSYIHEVERIIACWEQSVRDRTSNIYDAQFSEVFNFLQYISPNDIYQLAVHNFKLQPESWKIECLALPYRYSFLPGVIDFVKEDFSLIQQYINFIIENLDEWEQFYQRLTDSDSKQTLISILKYSYTYAPNIVTGLYRATLTDDIVQNTQQDIFELLNIAKALPNDCNLRLRFYGENEIWPCNYQLLAVG